MIYHFQNAEKGNSGSHIAFNFSILKDSGRVIRKLADGGDMAGVLVEQFYDFAEELADAYTVMARGQVIAQGAGCEMPTKGIRELVAI